MSEQSEVFQHVDDLWDDAVADKMLKELNDVVGVGIEPPFGGLVPFGKRSAFPHAVPSKDKLKAGDALILSFGAQVGGYNVECERSFSVEIGISNSANCFSEPSVSGFEA